MKARRDAQKARVYKAEDLAMQGPSSPRYGRVLKDDKAVAAFVKKTLERATIQRRYGEFLKQPVRVDFKAANARSCSGASYGITMTRCDFGRTEWIVLHELAHVIEHRMPFTTRDANGKREHHGGHGWRFCSIYLDLVRFGLGPKAHAALLASFKAHKVRYRPKRKSPVADLDEAA